MKKQTKCGSCASKAIYVAEDNDSIHGYNLACAKHLIGGVNQAFDFNEGNEPKNNFVKIYLISKMDKKLKEYFYILLK